MMDGHVVTLMTGLTSGSPSGPFPKASGSGFLETVGGRRFGTVGGVHVDSAFQFGDLLQ